MTMESRYEGMVILSHIHFDKCLYIRLVARIKGKDGHGPYSMNIAVHDGKGPGRGLDYEPGKACFVETFRELAGWMKEMEGGDVRPDEMKDLYAFFPDLGCRREPC